MHLVDVTLFYSPTSGGVKRYLNAKHQWLTTHTSALHTILVPGEQTLLQPGGVSTLAGGKVPGTFNYRLPLNTSRWIDLLDALEPDAIEVGDAFHTAWAAWRVAQRRGIPLVAFYHSNLPQLVGRRYGATLERGVARYVRWLYSRFDCVFAPSRFMCDYLDSIGVANTALQPLGVDSDVFHPARRTRDLRAELGLPRESRLLVYAGRFSDEKNIGVLQDAFDRLGDPYYLLLIGGAERRARSRNVLAIPYRRDSAELATWLASADALVHAGTEETFGLVILEAMACARPVVATRASAVPELVSDDVGVLARPHDAGSLAEAIVSLYERDLDALGRAARHRVLERFTWTRALSAQLATYASLSDTSQASWTSSNTVSFPLRSPTAT